MPPAPPSIALIVPVHRAGPDLDRCLRALTVLDPAPEEIVIAVDGPRAAADPDLSATLSRTGLPVVVTDHAGGPALARNVGASVSRADVLFFVDSDVVVRPDALRRLRSAMSSAEADAVFGSYDAHPGDHGFTSQYKNLTHHLVHQRARREGATFWGACGAVRRAAFEAVGGFDENYLRPCVEDIELGYRLRGAGYRVVVEPGLQVTHLKRWTVRSLLRTDLMDRAVPWSLLIFRSRVVVDDLGTEVTARVQLLLTAAALGAGATAAVTGSLMVALAGVGALGVVVLLDLPVLRGLVRLRGKRFAVRAVPWRITHQLVCLGGIGLAVFRMGLQHAGLRPGPTPALGGFQDHRAPGSARTYRLHAATTGQEQARSDRNWEPAKTSATAPAARSRRAS